MTAEFTCTGALRFGYGGNSPCLDIDDFEIQKGKVTVIAGENGSGKTTFLKILAGLLDLPNPGPGLAAVRSDSVYLHQTPYLFKGSVERNLSLAMGRRRASSESEHRAAVDNALATVGLTGTSGRPARALSGGQGKRVALARVFLSNRSVLLLDEPAAHADEKSVALIESACRLYARSGRSVVVATHRGGFGYRIADRMFELRNGRLEPGTSNILSGEVSRRDAAFLYFTAGEAEFRVPLRDGDFRVAVIPGEDVLLSVHPLESSARNCIEGTVTRLRTGPDGTLVASVDCGIPLEAVITSSAAVDLHLEAGRRVYATFKASSVRLY